MGTRGLPAIEGAKPGARNETFNAEYFRMLASGQDVDHEAVRIAALKSGLPEGEVEETMANAREGAAKKARPRFAKTAAGLRAALQYIGRPVRYNVRGSYAEFQIDGVWTRIQDLSEDKIRDMLEKKCDGVSSGQDKKRVPYRYGELLWKRHINVLCYDKQVDPFRIWLQEEIPAWDGKARLSSWLHEAFDWAGDASPELITWTSRYLFLAPIQRMERPGCELHEMPVFIGPQGCGKSRLLIEMFLTDDARQRFLIDKFNFLLPEQKKVESTLGKVIVEAGEMVGFRRADIESMKAFLTSRSDTVRLSYRRNPEDILRRFVFVGTSNSNILPNDPSGNRRFVALPIRYGTPGSGAGRGRHPRKIMEKIGRQLWAESLVEYSRGQRANLPETLTPAQNKVNEEYRQRDDTVEDIVREKLEEFKGKTMAQIKDGFGPLQTYSAHRIGKALQHEGLIPKQTSIDGKKGRYWVDPAEYR